MFALFLGKKKVNMERGVVFSGIKWPQTMCVR